MNFAVAAQKIEAHFFGGEGCIHCSNEKTFLLTLQKKYPNLNINFFEIYKNKSDFIWFKKAANRLNVKNIGVPFFVIGNQYFTGYVKGNTDVGIERAVNNCSLKRCPSLLENLFDTIDPEFIKHESMAAAQVQANLFNSEIDIPLLGKTKITKSVLPIFTVIMGTLDGFNPCAMWVLVFLIGLLLKMEDKRKRWILGLVFIAVSGFVYYLFMAAWLNLILFIGVVTWLRCGIGVVALAAGIYSLKDVVLGEYATCKVTASVDKKETFQKLRNIIHENNFLLALIGISILAFTVNLVELACSAGLPATYMQVLVLNNVPSWQYYSYMLLYILFFMLDDILVFFIAMLTLEITGLTNGYTKYSKLFGGVLMLALGILIIFKPRWLMFG